MNADIDQLRLLVAPIVGLVVTEARLSPMGGHWLGIDLTGGARIRTEMASWRMETDDEFLIASEDHRNFIRGFVTELDGRTVTEASISQFLDLTLDFDGLRLIVTITASARTDQVHWAIQLPSGNTLFAGPGSTWVVVGPVS